MTTITIAILVIWVTVMMILFTKQSRAMANLQVRNAELEFAQQVMGFTNEDVIRKHAENMGVKS